MAGQTAGQNGKQSNQATWLTLQHDTPFRETTMPGLEVYAMTERLQFVLQRASDGAMRMTEVCPRVRVMSRRQRQMRSGLAVMPSVTLR